MTQERSAPRELSVAMEGSSFLECPRWRDGRLWVSDFYTERVVATDGHGSFEVMAEVPGQPSGLGFLPDGRALIASMRDHRVLVREASGALSEHADLSDVVTGVLNDMVVDEYGRAFVGNFGFDLMGGEPLRYTTLTRVDPDGTVTTVAEELGFPNGMVILPGGVLAVAETFAGRITAFDIGENGELVNRRVWAQFGPTPQTDDVGEAIQQLHVGPDGICADAEGAIWVADALNERVLRVREGGEIVEEISTGTAARCSCARRLPSRSTNADRFVRGSSWPSVWTYRTADCCKPRAVPREPRRPANPVTVCSRRSGSRMP